MRIILISFILSSLCACAPFHKWDGADKALYAGFVACEIADYRQTVDILQDGNELNPVVKYGHESMGRQGVKLYFIGFAAGTYLIADNLSPKNRKAFLSIWDSIYVGIIRHNYQLGYKFKF